MAGAFGYLIDFQLVLITLDKMMILSCLWMFWRRTEEWSKRDRRREMKLTNDR